ncbi:MAG: ABC transporter permease [Clostridia bacterium]|nr:ABC transporter permease [Clostridia bacterium]
MVDLNNCEAVLDIPAAEIPEEWFERLGDEEKDSEFVAMQSKTYFQDTWAQFKKNRLALVSLVFLFILILAAIFVPIFSPYTYDGQDLMHRNAASSWQHPFGTDKFGRDIFVRVMYGARISLSVGFAAALLNLLIGVAYGGICGYIGGRVDLILMRIVDILYSVPTLLYVILIMLIFGSNIFSVLLAICVSSWVGMARQVRAQVLSLKEQEFAQAAFVLGASRTRILFKHLIINCMGPIIVNTTLMVPDAIFTEAFLAFVGIGISIPMASWGTMANDARSLIMLYPMQMVWPVMAISLTMLSLHFIGDGLSDALDPRKR